MTTRARRRQAAKRAVRWREQAARLIAAAHELPASIVRWTPYVRHGETFDVACVRTYCKRLLAEADELDMQREVFADWTRMRGMGPENRDRWGNRFDVWRITIEQAARGRWSFTVTSDKHHGAVMHYAATMRDDEHSIAVGLGSAWGSRQPGERSFVVYTSGSSIMVEPPPGGIGHAVKIDSFLDVRGGWPGKLARDYVAFKRAKRKCSRRDCDGGVLVGKLTDQLSVAAMTIEHSLHVGDTAYTARAVVSPVFTLTSATDGRVGLACPECERFAEAPTPRTFANGGNMRRAAQRLLDTLDGRCPWNDDAEAQPDECTHCCYAVTHDAEGRAWAARGHGWIDAGVLLSDVNVPLDYVPGVQARLRECPACSGTGHNLRGTLPPLPEATQRKLQHGRRLFPERNVRIPLAGSVEAIDLSFINLSAEDPT